MKTFLIAATGALVLAAAATTVSAKPVTGSDNRPEVGEKGPNGTAASTLRGDMGGHASGGKNAR